MKVFNRENGKEKVYVSRKDLVFLSQVYDIPQFIEEVLESDDNSSYVEFSSLVEIEYFKVIRWLLDFKELCKLSFDELNLFIEEMKTKANNTKLDMVSKSEWNHAYEDVLDFYNYRLGLLDLDLPLVPDDQYSHMESAGYSPIYIIMQAIDPNILMVCKDTGEKFSFFDNIPVSLMDSAINMTSMRRKDPPITLGNTVKTYRYSDDFQYYLIETKFNLYQKRDNRGKSLVKKNDGHNM